jgi:predicted O-methyltransferase YrrM
MLRHDLKVYVVDSTIGSQDKTKQTDHRRIIKRLVHKVNPIRMTTDEATKNFVNKSVDFLLIDAAYNYKAVYKNVMNWYPKLSKDGVICGDNFNNINVEKAAIDASAALNTTVSLFPDTTQFWKIDRNMDYQSTLEEPFKSAKLLPFHKSGSLPYPQVFQETVQKVVNAGGKIFVELGSWMGNSTRLIASNLPHGLKVYAVDTWKGSQDEIRQLNHPNIKQLFEYFLSNNIRKRLAHKIHPIRMTTDDAAKIFKKTIDFLFIDAAHNYKAVYNDIMNWYPKLSKDGVICGDDFNNIDVEKAAIDAAAVLNTSVSLVPHTTRFWKMDRHTNYQSSLPEPYKSAILLSYESSEDLRYPNELQAEVQKVVNAGGKIFVELGSSFGTSTRLIASKFPHGLKVYAVDTWKISQDEVSQTPLPKIKKLFEYFLSNNIKKRLAHKIHPIRLTTDEAAKNFNNTIDFLFIHSAHNYKAVYNDIMNWYPKLSTDGVICGDNFNNSNVEKAAIDAAAALNISVELVSNTTYLWKMY